eukprot:EG_transcript_9804
MVVAGAPGTLSRGRYSVNEDCSVVLQTDTVGCIELSVQSMATERGYDVVQVYDGATAASPPLAVYSGVDSGPVVRSTGPSLFVHWTSDSYLTGSGWALGYSRVAAAYPSPSLWPSPSPRPSLSPRPSPSPPRVPQSASPSPNLSDICVAASPILVVSGSRGTLSRGSYGNNEDCRVVLRAASPGRIEVTLLSLSTESGWDTVRVFDGPTAAGPLLAAWSGTGVSGGPVRSTGANLTVWWTSDRSVVGAGWVLAYSLVAASAASPSPKWRSPGPFPSSSSPLPSPSVRPPVIVWPGLDCGPHGFSNGWYCQCTDGYIGALCDSPPATGEGSNQALLGLLALVALPIVAVIGGVALYLRRRPRCAARSAESGPTPDPTVGVGGGGLRAMPPLQEPAAGDGGAEEELELSCGSPGEECYDAAWVDAGLALKAAESPPSEPAPEGVPSPRPPPPLPQPAAGKSDPPPAPP